MVDLHSRFGGQARNDVKKLGPDAILITHISRKYTSRELYANQYMLSKGTIYKNELTHRGPLQWIRDDVLSCANFNISPEDGRSIKGGPTLQDIG